MTRRLWTKLAVLCAAQFLVVLDITIVTVALPAIQSELGLSSGGLQWIVSGYAVVFGGFLLLAGRVGDAAGPRRVFLAGVVLFGVFSLLCGLAWNGEALIVARALQGLGAALISPSATAILAITFPAGPGRNRALGVWGSVGAAAAASGVLLGGVLVESLGWRSIFLVNAPVAAAALAVTPALLPRDSVPAARRRVDPASALLATGGLMALVGTLAAFGQGRGLDAWSSGLLGASAILLALLVAREARATDPLVPAAVLRSRTLAAANLAGFLHGAMMLASFLLLTLYMQRVVGLSPVEAGAGLLAVRGTSVVWANVGARAANAMGARRVLVAGMAGMTAGLLAVSRAPAGGSYLSDLLPGLLLLGAAIPLLFLAVSSLALEGVRRSEAGLASGLLNTSQWVGGAVGIAAVSAIAGARESALSAGGAGDVEAMVGGMHAGFLACAGLGVLGLAVALGLLRPRRPAPAGSPRAA